MNTHIIAQELEGIGFQTQITSIGVLVSLNRPITNIEVEIALEQVFESISFQISRVSKQAVLVS